MFCLVFMIRWDKKKSVDFLLKKFTFFILIFSVVEACIVMEREKGAGGGGGCGGRVGSGGRADEGWGRRKREN